MMARYKNNHPETVIGQLPLFPTPYPGESFYSVLCRYHVRSGNVNNWHTIRQLFGYNTSLASTLLSPYHLEEVRNWIPEASGITVENMLRQNTAFPLYAITSFRFDIEDIRAIVVKRTKTGTYPRWIQTKLIHPSRHLRFCPTCASEQKQLYGESYWQILPQLEGVEYCPVHKTRIKNSTVSLLDIRHHFYPASEVLNSRSGILSENSDELQVWEPLFESEHDFFCKMASEMNWLLQNGNHYEGYSTLWNTYSVVLRKEYSHSTIPTIKIKQLKELGENYTRRNMLYQYFTGSCSSNDYDGFGEFNIYTMPIYAHVMLMVLLCGSCKAFYSSA